VHRLKVGGKVVFQHAGGAVEADQKPETREHTALLHDARRQCGSIAATVLVVDESHEQDCGRDEQTNYPTAAPGVFCTSPGKGEEETDHGRHEQQIAHNIQPSKFPNQRDIATAILQVLG